MSLPIGIVLDDIQTKIINKCFTCQCTHTDSRIIVSKPSDERIHFCSMKCFKSYSESAKEVVITIPKPLKDKYIQEQGKK